MKRLIATVVLLTGCNLVGAASIPLSEEIILSEVHGTVSDTDPNKDGLGDGSISHKMQLLSWTWTEQRGITEFDISHLSGQVVSASLVLSKSYSDFPAPITINVRGYNGNGILDLDDFSARQYYTSVGYNNQPTLNIDVTPFIVDLVADSQDYAGFSLEVAQDIYIASFLWFYDESNSASVAPILEVQLASVPIPPTLYLFSSGLLGLVVISKTKHSG